MHELCSALPQLVSLFFQAELFKPLVLFPHIKTFVDNIVGEILHDLLTNIDCDDIGDLDLDQEFSRWKDL